jgi:hypothetical protein
MSNSASIDRILVTIIEGYIVLKRKFSAVAIKTSKKIVAAT